MPFPKILLTPPCPLDFIVVGVDIELSEEVVWKERFNLSDHLRRKISERFQKREEDVDLLIRQAGFNTVFISWFGVNDVSVARITRD